MNNGHFGNISPSSLMNWFLHILFFFFLNLPLSTSFFLSLLPSSPPFLSLPPLLFYIHTYIFCTLFPSTKYFKNTHSSPTTNHGHALGPESHFSSVHLLSMWRGSNLLAVHAPATSPPSRKKAPLFSLQCSQGPSNSTIRPSDGKAQLCYIKTGSTALWHRSWSQSFWDICANWLERVQTQERFSFRNSSPSYSSMTILQECWKSTGQTQLLRTHHVPWFFLTHCLDNAWRTLVCMSIRPHGKPLSHIGMIHLSHSQTKGMKVTPQHCL